jgi:hypothetical protein
MQYLIGQRVILNGTEIGTVRHPHTHQIAQWAPNTDAALWVFSPEKGYASHYSAHNIKPLPNGQL